MNWNWYRTDTLIYLSGAETDATKAAKRHNLGIMAQPGNAVWKNAGEYPCFAADNACFGQGESFDPVKWLAWLSTVSREGCLFASAPDVVGDAKATLERSRPYYAKIRELGFPAAFVAQNGLEDMWDEIPWDDFDVLFIGGSAECEPCDWVRPTWMDPKKVTRCIHCNSKLTEWKLSWHAELLAMEARERGKWVHVGRVNSWKRINTIRSWADSADGTFLKYGKTRNWPILTSWLDKLDALAQQPVAA